MSLAHTRVHPVAQPDAKPHPGRRMTEEEFVEWCDADTWAEWVDGEVITMASAVNIAHALMFDFFYRLLGDFVEQHGLGVVLCEPVHIRFAQLRRRRSPDILFVAESRRDMLKKQHIEGPPDLIIEIVSPGSETRDRRDKYFEYQAAGVREYWIAEPLSDTPPEAHTLGPDGAYNPIAIIDERIVSTVLPGFYIRPTRLSQSPLPRVADVLRELATNP